jgi:hypothetical protein
VNLSFDYSKAGARFFFDLSVSIYSLIYCIGYEAFLYGYAIALQLFFSLVFVKVHALLIWFVMDAQM